jgi:hypothetical protein
MEGECNTDRSSKQEHEENEHLDNTSPINEATKGKKTKKKKKNGTAFDARAALTAEQVDMLLTLQQRIFEDASLKLSKSEKDWCGTIA